MFFLRSHWQVHWTFRPTTFSSPIAFLCCSAVYLLCMYMHSTKLGPFSLELHWRLDWVYPSLIVWLDFSVYGPHWWCETCSGKLRHLHWWPDYVASCHLLHFFGPGRLRWISLCDDIKQEKYRHMVMLGQTYKNSLSVRDAFISTTESFLLQSLQSSQSIISFTLLPKITRQTWHPW